MPDTASTGAAAALGAANPALGLASSLIGGMGGLMGGSPQAGDAFGDIGVTFSSANFKSAGAGDGTRKGTAADAPPPDPAAAPRLPAPAWLWPVLASVAGVAVLGLLLYALRRRRSA
jgi:hypothetical protein